MSELEHEATDTPNTVEHFGRTWTLPSGLRAKDYHRFNGVMAGQHLKHFDLALAEAFLPASEFAVLLEDVNPDDKALDEFGTKIAKALGFGGVGNSEPSSASS
jgi:hypothetical protein